MTERHIHRWKAAYTRWDRATAASRALSRIGSWCQGCEAFERTIFGPADQKVGMSLTEIGRRAGVSGSTMRMEIRLGRLALEAYIDGEVIVADAEANRWLKERG